MDGLLGRLILFLGGKYFVYVVLAENVDFALKIQNPIFLSLSKKHVFVPWSFKMENKKCDSASCLVTEMQIKSYVGEFFPYLFLVFVYFVS